MHPSCRRRIERSMDCDLKRLLLLGHQAIVECILDGKGGGPEFEAEFERRAYRLIAESEALRTAAGVLADQS
jgi:hypothetical protein